jgi:hypothetical protein
MKNIALIALIAGLLVLGAVLLRSGDEPGQRPVSNEAEPEGSSELAVPPAAAPRSTPADSELRPGWERAFRVKRLVSPTSAGMRCSRIQFIRP